MDARERGSPYLCIVRRDFCFGRVIEGFIKAGGSSLRMLSRDWRLEAGAGAQPRVLKSNALVSARAGGRTVRGAPRPRARPRPPVAPSISHLASRHHMYTYAVSLVVLR
jgi:hypothetical protein